LLGALPLKSTSCCIALLLATAVAQDANRLPGQPVAAGKIVTLEPEGLDFGVQPVGEQTSPKTVSVTNTGTSPITISDILTSGIDFSQTSNCAQSLQSGASCAIQVTFKPAIAGVRTATLQIDDSAPESPQSIILTGTGQ
jgi:Abnormal spindle-like microcephaly-assoc'd, ASPM-SPD-2-Hydin